jgi:hypothetical protein
MAKRRGTFPTPHAGNGIRDSCRSFLIWHNPFVISCYYFPNDRNSNSQSCFANILTCSLHVQYAGITLKSLIQFKLIILQSKDRDLVSVFYMGISLSFLQCMLLAPLLSVICGFISGSSILIYWSMILFCSHIILFLSLWLRSIIWHQVFDSFSFTLFARDCFRYSGSLLFCISFWIFF